MKKWKKQYKENLKKAFRPEFLNRLDETIIFNQLSEDSILKIVDIMINETMGRLKEKNIDLLIMIKI